MKYERNCEGKIAKEIAAYTGYKTEVFPPMRMRASVSIYVKDNDGNFKGFITLTSKDGVVMYDTGEETVNYPIGSYGKMNGFGNEVMQLPDNIEDIWELVKFEGGKTQ